MRPVASSPRPLVTLCALLALLPAVSYPSPCEDALPGSRGSSGDPAEDSAGSGGPRGVPFPCPAEATNLARFASLSVEPTGITCGTPAETFCAMENPYLCDECDAQTPELSHPPELMTDSGPRASATRWQSATWLRREPPAPLRATVRLSWGGVPVELAGDLVVTFGARRPPPDAMLVERSRDHGRTWRPWQLLASDCARAFGMPARGDAPMNAANALQVFCTERYSQTYGLARGERVARIEMEERIALLGSLRSRGAPEGPGSPGPRALREFLTATDVRIQLLEPSTGDTGVDAESLSKYFYSIADIAVPGRCACPRPQGPPAEQGPPRGAEKPHIRYAGPDRPHAGLGVRHHGANVHHAGAAFQGAGSDRREAGLDLHDVGTDVQSTGPDVHDTGLDIHYAGPDRHDTGPDVHHSGPDVHQSGPDVHHTGPDGHHSGPDGHHSGPDRHDTGPDVHHSGPDVHHSGPDRHDTGPDVHHSGPDVHRTGPDRHDTGPDRHDTGPDVHHSGPDVHRTGPDRHDTGPDVHHSGPDVHHSGPDVHHSGPDRHDTGPDVHHSGPDRHDTGPDVDHSGPDVHRTGPDRDDTGPDVHHSGPDVHRTGPDVHHPGPDLHHAEPDHHDTGPDLYNTGPDVHYTGPDIYDTRPDQQPGLPTSPIEPAPLPAISFSNITGCQCHGHSRRCVPVGVRALACLSCRHDTWGPRCQRCRPGYHRNASARLHEPTACRSCQCEPLGSLHPRCDAAGQCSCLPGATGLTCSRCLPGFHWHGGCRANLCDDALLRCHNAGVCLEHSRCLCPPRYAGPHCQRELCPPGGIGVPEGHGEGRRPRGPSGVCGSRATSWQRIPSTPAAAAVGAVAAVVVAAMGGPMPPLRGGL
ncbi:netrin-G1-like [Petromyzon marinus]|uniref:netrin-G1-like n=1 Tax=Petromyzon marinus TaxID=7757 RepID=UPI003F6EC662